MEPLNQSNQNNAKTDRNSEINTSGEFGKLEFPERCASLRSKSILRLNSVQTKLAAILVSVAGSIGGAETLYAKDKGRGCGKDQSCTREREARERTREPACREPKEGREHEPSDHAREAREAKEAEGRARAQAEANARAEAAAKAQAEAAAKAAEEARATAKAEADAKAKANLDKLMAEAIKAEQAKQAENSCKAQAQSSAPEIFERNSAAIQKETQKVEVCTRDADVPGNVVGIQHEWIRTREKEAGMGPQDGGVPGQDGSNPEETSPVGTPTSVNDHTGQGNKPGSTCKTVPDVDKNCVNNELELGRPLGDWSPNNNCQEFVKEVIENCTKDPNLEKKDGGTNIPFEDSSEPPINNNN